MNDRNKIYTVLELLCVFFWFLLDGCWLFEWKTITYCFSVVAIGLGFAMTFYQPPGKAVGFIASADQSWLLCNCLWAVGDLDHRKWALVVAKVCFVIGLYLWCAAFVVSEPGKKLSVLVLSRLRIMKFFELR